MQCILIACNTQKLNLGFKFLQSAGCRCGFLVRIGKQDRVPFSVIAKDSVNYFIPNKLCHAQYGVVTKLQSTE